MFKMNAGYFLIQLASEKDKERVYKLCGQYSREDAHGVALRVRVWDWETEAGNTEKTGHGTAYPAG
jgi:hypothetical protein